MLEVLRTAPWRICCSRATISQEGAKLTPPLPCVFSSDRPAYGVVPLARDIQRRTGPLITYLIRPAHCQVLLPIGQQTGVCMNRIRPLPVNAKVVFNEVSSVKFDLRFEIVGRPPSSGFAQQFCRFTKRTLHALKSSTRKGVKNF